MMFAYNNADHRHDGNQNAAFTETINEIKEAFRGVESCILKIAYRYHAQVLKKDADLQQQESQHKALQKEYSRLQNEVIRLTNRNESLENCLLSGTNVTSEQGPHHSATSFSKPDEECLDYQVIVKTEISDDEYGDTPSELLAISKPSINGLVWDNSFDIQSSAGNALQGSCNDSEFSLRTAIYREIERNISSANENPTRLKVQDANVIADKTVINLCSNDGNVVTIKEEVDNDDYNYTEERGDYTEERGDGDVIFNESLSVSVSARPKRKLETMSATLPSKRRNNSPVVKSSSASAWSGASVANASPSNDNDLPHLRAVLNGYDRKQKSNNCGNNNGMGRASCLLSLLATYREDALKLSSSSSPVSSLASPQMTSSLRAGLLEPTITPRPPPAPNNERSILRELVCAPIIGAATSASSVSPSLNARSSADLAITRNPTNSHITDQARASSALKSVSELYMMERNLPEDKWCT